MFSTISIKTFCKINKRVTQLPKKIVGPAVKKNKNKIFEQFTKKLASSQKIK